MSQLKGATHERAYWISIRKVGMTYWEIGLTVITLAFYCVSNSAIMAGLFMVAQPTMPFSIGFKKVLGKTVVSLGIVFCFYLLPIQQLNLTLTSLQLDYLRSLLLQKPMVLIAAE